MEENVSGKVIDKDLRHREVGGCTASPGAPTRRPSPPVFAALELSSECALAPGAVFVWGDVWGATSEVTCVCSFASAGGERACRTRLLWRCGSSTIVMPEEPTKQAVTVGMVAVDLIAKGGDAGGRCPGEALG